MVDQTMTFAVFSHFYDFTTNVKVANKRQYEKINRVCKEGMQ